MDWQVASCLRNSPFQDEFKYLCLLSSIKMAKKKKKENESTDEEDDEQVEDKDKLNESRLNKNQVKIVKNYLPPLGILCENLNWLMGVGDDVDPRVSRVLHKYKGACLRTHMKMLLGLILTHNFRVCEVLATIKQMMMTSNSGIRYLDVLTLPSSQPRFPASNRCNVRNWIVPRGGGDAPSPSPRNLRSRIVPLGGGDASSPSPHNVRSGIVPLGGGDTSSPSPRKRSRGNSGLTIQELPDEPGELFTESFETPRKFKVKNLVRTPEEVSRVTMVDDNSSICSQDKRYMTNVFSTLIDFDEQVNSFEENASSDFGPLGLPINSESRRVFDLQSPSSSNSQWDLGEQLIPWGEQSTDQELMDMCEREFTKGSGNRVARSPVNIYSISPLTTPLTSSLIEVEPNPAPSTIKSQVVAGPSHDVAGPSHVVAGPSHVEAGPSHSVVDPRLAPLQVYQDTHVEMPPQPRQSNGVEDPHSAPSHVNQECRDELFTNEDNLDVMELDMDDQLEVPQRRTQRRYNKTLHKSTMRIRTGRGLVLARIQDPSISYDFVKNRCLTDIIVPPGPRDPTQLDRRSERWLTNNLEWDLTKGHSALHEPLPVYDLRNRIRITVPRPSQEISIEDLQLENPDLSWSDIQFCESSITTARPMHHNVNDILHDFLDTDRMPCREDAAVSEEFPLDFVFRRAPVVSTSVLMRYPDWDRRHRRAQQVPVLVRESVHQEEHHLADDVQQTVFEMPPRASEDLPVTPAETTSKSNVKQMPSRTVSGQALSIATMSSLQSVERPLFDGISTINTIGRDTDPKNTVVVQSKTSTVTTSEKVDHSVEGGIHQVVETPQAPAEAAAQPSTTPAAGEMPPPTIIPPRRSRRPRVQRILFDSDDLSEDEPPRRRKRRRRVRRAVPVEAVEPQPPAPQIQENMETVDDHMQLPIDENYPMAMDVHQPMAMANEVEDILPSVDTNENSRMYTEDEVLRILEEKVKVLGETLRFSDCCEVGVCSKRRSASFFQALLVLYARGDIDIWQDENTGDPTRIFIKLLQK